LKSFKGRESRAENWHGEWKDTGQGKSDREDLLLELEKRSRLDGRTKQRGWHQNMSGEPQKLKKCRECEVKGGNRLESISLLSLLKRRTKE